MELESVVLLRSNKAQLEVGLLYLKRRLGELQRQLAAAEKQFRNDPAQVELVARLRLTVRDHAGQVERHALDIKHIEDQIAATHVRNERSGAEGLTAESEALSAQMAEIRAQVLDALRLLAEPLRQYESLAEKKSLVTGELTSKTGRSQAYADYLESALFRQTEYIDDVRYVVETLRRQRVVA